MKSIGCRIWAIADGHIPLVSHGKEPTFTSHDKLCILNTSGDEAQLELTVYYPESEPDGPYPLQVPPRRVRHIRVNDLINPRAIPLDVPYGLVIVSSVDVIVQFSRRDTSQDENAIMTTMAYPVRMT
jgi:hypothetical protein